jgi:CheY-like chemotaxis protein
MEGYAVVEAADGGEALQAIEGQAPDLILLDVVMPGVDGWQMLQRMQEQHGSIPVIMFSGKVDEQSVDDAAHRGALGFIGKPFDPQQLIDRAKQLVPV